MGSREDTRGLSASGSYAVTTMHHLNITRLFKYRIINRDTREALRKQKIWVASPDSFDDPFDTNTDNYIEELSPETIETFTRRGYPQIRNMNPSTLHAQFVKQAKKFGVLCLTENCESILMWSRYANGHRGLCLEFERTSNSVLGDHERTGPVSYTRLCPVLDNKNQYDESNRKAFGLELERLMLVKAEGWRYEREWRTYYPSVNCLEDYPGPLKSIIWGLCTDEKDKVKVRDLVKGSNVVFKQATRVRREFRISIEDEQM